MGILITRTVVVPLWLLAGALVVVWAAPSGMARVLLLISGGLVGVAILLFGKKTLQPPLSDGPPIIDVTPLSVTEVPLAQPLSWPNSGFRNIGRGTKGG